MTTAAAARDSQPVDVLLVARPDDRHADAVASELGRRGAAVARTSLDRLRATQLSWQPGEPLLLAERDEAVAVDPGTTTWWRRPGRVSTDDLDPDEAGLAQAEGAAILQGSLRAAVGRWVDPPPVVDAAEDKLYQLQTAHTLGVAVPNTLVTSDPTSARAFAAAGPVLAKAVSIGSGIAPYADKVTASKLKLVAACPVLLQRAIPATADLRVITVGTEALAWSRRRDAAEPLDWRLADPAGEEFRPCPGWVRRPPGAANRRPPRAHVLGPGLACHRGCTGVLGGQPARSVAVPRRRRPASGPSLGRPPPRPMTAPTPAPPPDALAHGGTGQAADLGCWPQPLRRFWWDLLPGWLPDRLVPPAGGVRAPPYTPPSWLAEDVAGTPDALEQAKRSHDIAMARVQTVEAKADRLAQRALALLALAFALAGWQLRAGITHGGGWWHLLLVPAGAAIAALAVAGIIALELDRPGMFYTPKAASLRGRTDLIRARVEAEDRARDRATWTAERKYDDHLAARAWFSRGLVALAMAALVAVLSLGAGGPRRHPPASTSTTGEPATTQVAPSPTTLPAPSRPPRTT